MQTNSIITQKRTSEHIATADINKGASKKRKVEDDSIYKLAEIIVVDQPRETDKNIVWMHLDDINELFGTGDHLKYVQVANCVYKVVLRNIPKGSICINRLQNKEISQSITRVF